MLPGWGLDGVRRGSDPLAWSLRMTGSDHLAVLKVVDSLGRATCMSEEQWVLLCFKRGQKNSVPCHQGQLGTGNGPRKPVGTVREILL